MSITFTKIYVDTRINGTSIMQFTFKNWVIIYKHKAGTYIHHMKNYCGSLLALVTCESIWIDAEECLRRKLDRFNV